MAKDSTGTILLLGGLGVAVYGYMNGWFNSFLGGTSTVLAAATPATPTTPATPAARPVPVLGTTVTNSTDALAQISANDPYVIPDAATFASMQTVLPSGWASVQTTDKGGVFLRPDVYGAVQSVIQGRLARAAGAPVTSLQTAALTNLGEIQRAMTNQGLSGLGDFRRHMYARSGR